MKKIIKKIWRQEKFFIIVFLFTAFLCFNLVRATTQINELRAENAELWEMLDHYTPTAEEND